MLDTRGIIRVLRLTQARHIDAARDLLYHNPARSIGLCESKQPHRAMERAFYVPRSLAVIFTPDMIDRFWAKVDKTGDCWLWTGGRNRGAYGVFQCRIDGKVRRLPAHRVAYDLTHDRPLGEMLGCHTCDNPPCVRPDHIFPGTDLDNALDSIAKGRHNSVTHPECQVRGEAAWHAKLTAPIVMQIREEYASTLISTRALAERYGVSKNSIRCLINGKSWSHLPLISTTIQEKDRFAAATLRGDDHPKSVLSVAEMREIAATCAAGGVTRKELAAIWGVKVGVIGNATTKYR